MQIYIYSLILMKSPMVYYWSPCIPGVKFSKVYLAVHAWEVKLTHHHHILFNVGPEMDPNCLTL